MSRPAFVAKRGSAALIAALATGIVLAPARFATAGDSPIAGIWLPDGSRSERFPSAPPYTAEGRRIVEEWRASHDPIEDDPGKFCQAPGMPSVALGGAEYPVEIIVTGDQVTILMEAHQQVRRIFLDQDAHPERPFPQRNGHSIGHWEDDMLVVDTTAIRAITYGAVPHSDRVHVVERIRAVDDGAALRNEVTITDPVMYTAPIVVKRYYRAAPAGTRMLEYECTEGMWLDHERSRGIDAAAAAPGPAAAGEARPVTRGIYNWVRTTGDAEHEFAFFEQVFGLELERSPFAGPAPADAPPSGILPVDEARSDRLVWNLTDTEGARFRTAFMRAPNTPFGLELSEFFDIPRAARPANAWDPGASMLIFNVRDLESIVARLAEAGAPVLTLGGAPLQTPDGRSVLVRSPDGYLVRVTQASPAAIAAASDSGDIVATSIGISVADTANALAYYRDLLGFEAGARRRGTAAELRLHGLAEGELEQTAMLIPGTDVAVTIAQFSLPRTADLPVHAYRWRIQDVGAPQFQLQVAGLDALLQRTRQAGYRFLSVGDKPIERPFGRFVFAIDPDGILVEYVEPEEIR